jgi:hypothetical protein
MNVLPRGAPASAVRELRPHIPDSPEGRDGLRPSGLRYALAPSSVDKHGLAPSAEHSLAGRVAVLVSQTAATSAGPAAKPPAAALRVSPVAGRCRPAPARSSR